MAFSNHVVWLLGLLLEGTLLWRLCRQQILRKVSFFSALLCFYMFRSILLMVAGGRVSRSSYAGLFSALSLIDFGMQVALAVWLFVRLSHTPTEKKRHASGLQPYAIRVPVGFLLACGATLLVIRAMPAHSPVPLDRAAIFCGFLYLELAVWAWSRWEGSTEGTLLTGFACLGLANILSQCSKSAAALHNQPRVFVAWAYFDAAVWLLVLAFWNVRFSPRLAEGTQHSHSADAV